MVFTAPKILEYVPNNCTVISVTKLYKNNVYIIYNAVIFKLMVTGMVARWLWPDF